MTNLLLEQYARYKKTALERSPLHLNKDPQPDTKQLTLDVLQQQTSF